MSIPATQLLSNLISAVWSRVEGRGFSRSGSRLYCKIDGNWGLIEFQKSRESTESCVKFTVNIGAASTDLQQRLGQDVKRPASSADCHWRMRLGSLWKREDIWWTLTKEEDVELAEADISTALEDCGLAMLFGAIRTADMLRMWEEGKSAGISDLLRRRYVASLSGFRD